MRVFIVTFIILTLAHPIADYMISKEKRIPWHYFLSLNPLHFIWDETLGKKHEKYVIHTAFKGSEIVLHQFWFWLGIDQLAHVMLNLIFTVFLEVLF